MIKMPFASGSTWTISQGYNTDPNAGGSHYNCLEYPERSCSQYWTYKYSFDIVKADGNTAGQTVLSPVSGTIRWIDEAYGGMSINLGNGWAVAYFHTTLAPGLAAGQTVVQGQYMGTVAPPGQGGNGGFPHIHVTLWKTTDGGNWSRIATPFSGEQSLDGYNFPNLDGSPRNQYRGTSVTSSNTQVGEGITIPRQVAKLSPTHGASVSQSTVTLSWSPAAGATSYQVLVDDGGQTSPWVTGTSWTTNTLAGGTHTWKVRARNAAGTGSWSSTWRFTVNIGMAGNELDDGAMIGQGVYKIIGTRQGMVGGVTSSGHVIVENDHFVSLPACTNITCDWLTPGTTHPTYGYVTNCGTECFVMILNPITDKCEVAPVLDRGPWFNVDNFWDVPNKRFVNQKIAEKGLTYSLAQGYSAAPAARAGYDVGWGKTGNIGNSNQTSNGVHYPVGLPVSIDIGDGTWLELGFPWDPGPQNVTVTMLWQVSMTVAEATAKCEGTQEPPAPKPYFTTSKTSGVAGAVMSVSGKNYGPNEAVKIYLDSSKTTPIGTGQTDATGRFSTTFTVPETLGGLHRIHIVGQTSKLRIAKDFRILPKASSDKTSGSANITVTLKGSNFGAGEVVNVFWDTNTTSVATGTADSAGNVTIKARTPSTNGAHTARLTGQTWNLSAKTGYSVVQRVRVTPSESEAGTTIKAYGTGWPANKTIAFRWDSKTGTILCSAISDANGYAECTFLPANTAEAGQYRIYGTNGTLSASAIYTLVGFGDTEDPSATPTAEATEPVIDATPEVSPTADPSVEAPTEEPTIDGTPTEDVVPTESPTPGSDSPTETAVPTEEATEAPEPQTVELVAVADTSVSYANPDASQPADLAGSLQAGGPETAVAYISFSVEGVGSGIVTEAYLVLTGTEGGGPGGTIGVVPGYIVDESGTYRTLPTQNIDPAWALDGTMTTMGSIGPDEVVSLDVTRSIQTDGQYTFVILGNADQVLGVSSREGTAPPRLVLVVQQ